MREAGFPVFARGVIPIPGAKKGVTPLGEGVRCGGVRVEAGDVVVADAAHRARIDELLAQGGFEG